MENPPDKSELAEVKEALGRLYKRIEEAEAASKEQREKDRQVLNLWAETNLVQTELLSKQTKLIDQLTQELQKNETFWQKFARNSADLMRDLLDLKGQLMGMPLPVSSDEPKRIEAKENGEPPVMMPHRMKPREMLELEATLARLWSESEEMPAAMRLERLSRIATSLEEIRTGKQRIQKIEFDVIPLDQKTAVRMMSIAMIAVAASVAASVVFMDKSTQVQEIKAAVNTVNSRLTRLEKLLGTGAGK